MDVGPNSCQIFMVGKIELQVMENLTSNRLYLNFKEY